MTKKARRQKVTSAKLVVKDNKLINARYNMSVTEMRLFLSMITQITRDDKDFTTYRIQIADFAEALGTSAKNIYDRAQQVSKRLMEKVLEIEEEDGPLQVALLSSVKYYTGKGYVDLRFDPALKPYLLQLKEKFTAYDIRNIIKLQSSHSIRIYEMLKQYERIGKRTIPVEELKEILGVADQYKRYNDFKRFVLLQAQKDLKAHCDITFEFQEKKQGRRIDQIIFIIQKAPSPVKTETNDETTPNSEIAAELLRIGLTQNQVDEVLSNKPETTIQTALEYTKNRYLATKGTESEIRNLPGYFLKILDSEMTPPAFVAETDKRTKKLKAEAERKASAKAEKQKAEELIERLKSEYQTYRRTRADQKELSSVTEEEWEAFENRIRDNIFLSRKLMSRDRVIRDHEETVTWLKPFLLEQEWPDTPQTFVEWVKNQFGYTLDIVTLGGDISYRLNK